ncbi:MAG: tRNA (adenosine(37)-N6)-threonylcarbamoyltransferase complex ATPase subunit type 1 TsaE [bacterium]
MYFVKLKTKKDTVGFANQIANICNNQTPQPPLSGGLYVVALIGELGVGKTFFTKALGKALGVKETIKSPSFNLMKVYEIPGRRTVETRQCLVSTQIKTLVHVDCYRLNSAEELIDIGLLDYFGYNNTLIVIEWADKIKKILPKDAVWVKFKMGKDGVRMAAVNLKPMSFQKIFSINIS